MTPQAIAGKGRIYDKAASLDKRVPASGRLEVSLTLARFKARVSFVNHI